jgi:hypothetical protein
MEPSALSPTHGRATELSMEALNNNSKLAPQRATCPACAKVYAMVPVNLALGS